jgi:hypothetical protein
MNRRARRVARRAPFNDASGARPPPELFKAIEDAVPQWCALAKSLGDLKDCCATITPHGQTYVSTRVQAIESLTQLGRLDVAAAVRRASTRPGELLIVGVKDDGYMAFYGSERVSEAQP